MTDQTVKRVTRSTNKLSISTNQISQEKLTRRERLFNEIDIDERENVEIERINDKPTELFDESNDMSGSKFYKQSETCKTGKMMEKAKSCSLASNNFKKQTPKRNRSVNRLNKGFSSDEEEDYGSSGDDDYVADDDDDDSATSYEQIDNETDEDENESEYEDENEDEDVEMKGEIPKPNLKKLPISSSHNTKKVSSEDNDYNDIHLNTEEYFESQSEKILTSNRTLGRLKTSKLDKQTIDELLENNLHISDSHSDGIRRLNEKNMSQFKFWHFLLQEGFNILLHGLGSKRNLIHDFHAARFDGFPTLVVNGFFPSLTLKEILDGILKDLMGLEVPPNVNDCMDLIEETLKKHPDDQIYLLIHNIDGPMLRSKKVQDKLSYLASFPNLHLVASVDHINASLLWDNAKRSRYNFYWCNATTFLPYKEETLYENSLMVRQSGALALSSLHNVFLSLPDKSRSVYIILVKYQLEKSGANYQGMAFKDLLQQARAGFFVTNDVTLRSQLTEFLDHKLVKEKRGIDGIQYLNIPLDNGLLKQFLEQQEES